MKILLKRLSKETSHLFKLDLEVLSVCSEMEEDVQIWRRDMWYPCRVLDIFGCQHAAVPHYVFQILFQNGRGVYEKDVRIRFHKIDKNMRIV